jgi:site-specific DNA-methyltransferase (adenine-specific)
MSTVIGKCELFNEDCMITMARYPDKHFDLAIVDPPYGILNKTKRGTQRSPHLYKVRAEGWDSVPDEIYFNEIMRVSENQIICGGNYFNLPLTNAWLFFGINTNQ